MARNITYREALNEALTQEMERDETVIVMGEDNAGGAGAPGDDDAWGGVLGVTKGLYHKFPGRVLDTPISESAFIGAAIGAATAGIAALTRFLETLAGQLATVTATTTATPTTTTLVSMAAARAFPFKLCAAHQCFTRF